MARLDEADKWGSVIGGVATLLGLPMAIHGLVLAVRDGGRFCFDGRRQWPVMLSDASGEVHQPVTAGRDAYTAGHDQYFGLWGAGSPR